MTTQESLRQIRALHDRAENSLKRGDWEQARSLAQAIIELDALNLAARDVLERVGVGLDQAAEIRLPLWRRSLPVAWKLMNNRVTRRFALMVVIIWAASTVMFIIPRVWGDNPSRAGLFTGVDTSRQGTQPRDNTAQTAFQRQFGLEDPQVVQYARYITALARFDLGPSRRNFPTTNGQLIRESLWWTLSLVGVSTVLAFGVGTIVGGLMGWPNAPGLFRYSLTPFLVVSAVPYYLLGWFLIWFAAFRWGLFPLGGGYDTGTQPEWSIGFAFDYLHHAFLPGVSIFLASVGLWAVNMRGMIVTVQGEDYMIQGAAKGLKRSRMFLRYGVRNAIVPQVTGLAASVGTLMTGVILVEIVFRYPGVGLLLLQSLRGRDVFMLTGIVYVVIVLLAVSMFLIDILYPVLDPRIRARTD